jgi:hypothetical protein
MDFSGATTLMTTFKTFAIYAGAVICFGGLIFAGIRMMSGRFADAIPGLFGALFGAGVLGWGAGWIEVIRSLDKKAQCEYSLRFLVASRSVDELRGIAPAVHRVFVDARAQVMEETLGNLSAFYAMFPGNHKFNVFPMWLAEDHHARLSSIFVPHLGHPYSEDLDNEYLNIFETRTRTPFFQDVYVDGVRVMLILGPTGSGKSVVGNATVALEQKYGGFTYIFDIGGSYESVVELYGWLGQFLALADSEELSAGHGFCPHNEPVMPWPSVIVKMRSLAGSLTISLAPDGQ